MLSGALLQAAVNAQNAFMADKVGSPKGLSHPGNYPPPPPPLPPRAVICWMPSVNWCRLTYLCKKHTAISVEGQCGGSAESAMSAEGRGWWPLCWAHGHTFMRPWARFYKTSSLTSPNVARRLLTPLNGFFLLFTHVKHDPKGLLVVRWLLAGASTYLVMQTRLTQIRNSWLQSQGRAQNGCGCFETSSIQGILWQRN